MSKILFVVLLAGCGGSTQAPQTSSAPAPAAKPSAPVAAAPAAAPVGPDGPEDLAIPAFTVDAAQADKGKAVFEAKGCGGCHQFGAKLVGPDLNGIGERRSQKWIARMVKHPEEMTKKDPVAKGLFREMMVQMSNQGVEDDQVGPLISFLVSHPSSPK